jgi:hypothetical protein
VVAVTTRPASGLLFWWLIVLVAGALFYEVACAPALNGQPVLDCGPGLERSCYPPPPGDPIDAGE